MRYRLRMETESNTPEPQTSTYVVGLPVIVTVGPEGYVTVDVDLSDLGVAIDKDDETEVDDERRHLDSVLADRWADEHAVRNEGWTRVLSTIPTSVRSLRRATFEVHAHAGDDKWTLYRRVGDGWLRLGQYADKRDAIKAGEAL